jgi:hypothetical protein
MRVLLPIFAQAGVQEKMLDDIAKKQESILPGSYTVPLIAYAVIGLIVLGNWKTMNGGQRFLAFVFFPAHVVLMFVLGFGASGARGVGEQEDVRKVVGLVMKVVAFVVFIAFLAYLAHGGR